MTEQLTPSQHFHIYFTVLNVFDLDLSLAVSCMKRQDLFI